MTDPAILDAITDQSLLYPAPDMALLEPNPLIASVLQYGLDSLRADLLQPDLPSRPASIQIGVVIGPNGDSSTQLFANQDGAFLQLDAEGAHAPYQAIGRTLAMLRQSLRTQHFVANADLKTQPSHDRIAMMRRLSGAHAFKALQHQASQPAHPVFSRSP